MLLNGQIIGPWIFPSCVDLFKPQITLTNILSAKERVLRGQILFHIINQR